jgi:hypothetical protein
MNKTKKRKGTKPNERESNANKFTLRELKKALDSHKEREDLNGRNNLQFKNGNGEKYKRLIIKGLKVKRSHIVWRLVNKKKIKKGYNIHHKDENKRNDNILNLELIKAQLHGNLNLRQNNPNLNSDDKKNITEDNTTKLNSKKGIINLSVEKIESNNTERFKY